MSGLGTFRRGDCVVATHGLTGSLLALGGKMGEVPVGTVGVVMGVVSTYKDPRTPRISASLPNAAAYYVKWFDQRLLCAVHTDGAWYVSAARLAPVCAEGEDP